MVFFVLFYLIGCILSYGAAYANIVNYNRALGRITINNKETVLNYPLPLALFSWVGLVGSLRINEKLYSKLPARVYIMFPTRYYG